MRQTPSSWKYIIGGRERKARAGERGVLNRREGACEQAREGELVSIREGAGRQKRASPQIIESVQPREMEKSVCLCVCYCVSCVRLCGRARERKCLVQLEYT